MPRAGIQETPFSLTYGTKAVIPTEIGVPTERTLNASATNNDEELRRNLDFLEERREKAADNIMKYKTKMAEYYNRRVWPYAFKVDDYVLRDNGASKAATQGKLRPKWEGPYLIKEVKGKGAYVLSQQNETILKRTWNAAQLRKCYILFP
jgi:hypothetical protein